MTRLRLPLTTLRMTGRPRADHSLRIVELRRGDTATVLAVFQGLSARSRFLRFHTGQPVLPGRMLRRLADTEPLRHVVHVALVGDRPVGLARWIRFPGHRSPTAEIAVEVVDQAHGRGIGQALVGAAARSAARAGVQEFLAYVVPGNTAVLDWAAELGIPADPADPSALRVPVAALLPVDHTSSQRRH